MCYNVKAQLESQIKYAKRYLDDVAVNELLKKLSDYLGTPMYHLNAYSHPKILIYKDSDPVTPSLANWGLVASWVKDRAKMLDVRKFTLNARIEGMFTTASYKNSARQKRCIFFVDGFFEFHHFKSKAFPFYIFHKSSDPMCMAGLWNEWLDKETGELIETFTMVTRSANPIMAKIHNKGNKGEPRMPLILDESQINDWLEKKDISDNLNPQELFPAMDQENFRYHTVEKLSGKNYLGNVPESSEIKEYEELVF